MRIRALRTGYFRHSPERVTDICCNAPIAGARGDDADGGTMRVRHTATIALLAFGACARRGASSPAPTLVQPSATTSSAYAPVIDPARFTSTIDNPFMPLVPGTTFVFDGHKEGAAQHIETTVTGKTKVIMGVTCVVVSDVITEDDEVEERTLDWYAQDDAGNVWYFGENARDYDTDGRIVSRQGSWEAGVKGAQPGIVMHANPAPGATYRQEYFKGETEDVARVVNTGVRVSVPAGTYTDTVVTYDSTVLEPGKIEAKYYARGVGLVRTRFTRGADEVTELVAVRRA
jgi:hypothetical protein